MLVVKENDFMFKIVSIMYTISLQRSDACNTRKETPSPLLFWHRG